MKVVWSDDFTKTFFAPPEIVPAWTSRMKKFKEEAITKGLELVEPPLANIDDFLKVHCRELVEKVIEASEVGGVVDYGDTYVYPGSLPVLLRDLGGVYKAYEVALEQGFGYTPYGGLHHAKRCSAAGFCPLNDVAVLIQKLTEEGKRVAYIDTDVHHGDGTQQIFYDRNDVLTISLHMYYPGFYPGTGHYSELGEGEGYGYSLNVPLPPGTGDQAYIYAFNMVVKRAVEEFKPDVIVAQMGVDGFREDPLGGRLNLGLHTFFEIGRYYREVGIPVAGTGGGGYGELSVKAMMAELGFEDALPIPSPKEVFERIDYIVRYFEEHVDWF